MLNNHVWCLHDFKFKSTKKSKFYTLPFWSIPFLPLQINISKSITVCPFLNIACILSIIYFTLKCKYTYWYLLFLNKTHSLHNNGLFLYNKLCQTVAWPAMVFASASCGCGLASTCCLILKEVTAGYFTWWCQRSKQNWKLQRLGRLRMKSLATPTAAGCFKQPLRPVKIHEVEEPILPATGRSSKDPWQETCVLRKKLRWLPVCSQDRTFYLSARVSGKQLMSKREQPISQALVSHVTN